MNNNKFKTSIGGQAVIEGVMMKGPSHSALAVRTPSGEIDVTVEERNTKPFMKAVMKIPFVRGIFGFIDSIVGGMKYLSLSAEKSGLADYEEEEPGRFEKWLDKVFGKNLMKVIMAVGMVLGLALAVGLFVYLPSLAVSGINSIFPLYWGRAVLEGLIKIAIFILYLLLVSRMSDIRRTFEYHGAEHKTIFCYEKGEELTVANVKKQKRFHPRCGTSFLVLVLIISILVSSFISWDNLLIRTVLKIALIPVVMGISYELLKLAGRHDNIFTRIISAPGLWIQRITTKEPDESQIEVAIESMKPVLPQEGENDKW